MPNKLKQYCIINKKFSDMFCKKIVALEIKCNLEGKLKQHFQTHFLPLEKTARTSKTGGADRGSQHRR